MHHKILTILFFCLCLYGNLLFVLARIPGNQSSQTGTICFGDLTNGEVSTGNLFSDSLHFTNALLDSINIVKSFNLTILCNGQVLKYLENKSGNKLTSEMKEAISKFHPGCMVVFDGIKTVYIWPDKYGRYILQDWGGPLRLKLK